MRIIGGRWRGRRLLAPTGKDVRPTADRTREALFNILAHAPLGQAPLGRSLWVDVFCGTGAVGLEALSRGAEACVFIDKDVSFARSNATALGVAPPLLQTDAARLPACPLPRPADFAFLDPPYGRDLLAPALDALRGGGWLAPTALLILESAASETINLPAAFRLYEARAYGAAKLWFVGQTQGENA
ncbi:16S rRNA (guanine(966)-N(2))-methyltransferase RsmD [Elstera cyanobacteriorum]|uniref:16S rRNA (guanine(966)-N(2))-methyltransferase RsmD n=1 Tax=Elstera cyanobacteriorum TaxID=2022747 RepID=UPI002352BC09|nr:16S rRNA (guanine(966)-N(2))-methyltransferase RsmD [Elstera cyanobacteriorum]MCK6442762.1 16S rRNA (guanine(966)-N(2))-methyltransferase RsmD [Elstera cyanobacteriorum]